MGKIADALEKYNKDRKTARLPRLTRADLEVLTSYNRETGYLLINDRQIGQGANDKIESLRIRGTIQRLMDNKLVLPSGKLTPKGIASCERLSKSEHSSFFAKTPDETPADEFVEETKSRKADDALVFNYYPKSRSVAEMPPAEIEPPFSRVASDESVHAPSPQLLTAESKVSSESTQVAPEIPKPSPAQPPASAPPGEDKGEVSDAKKAKAADMPTDMIIKPVDAKREKKTTIVPGHDAAFDQDHLDPNLVSFLYPQSHEAEQFKILRSNILFPVAGVAPKSILVTGALPGDGKSFVSANLSTSIAQNINKHVLLIDCDLRQPTIHRMFGFDKVMGLSDYLLERGELESLLLRTCVDKLTLLPGGPEPSNPSELMSTERMAELIEEVKLRYHDRLIVLDSPPPGFAAETAFLARQVDGVVVVVKYGKTPREEVENLIETVGSDKIIGVVINYLDRQVSGRYGYKKYNKYAKRYQR